jgi:hypothetical protein
MLVTAGQRVYFNQAMADPPVYVEISRPEASDLQSEIAVCHFQDGAKTVIDWAASLPNLRTLAQDRKYTQAMVTTCLHRLVSRYAPDQSHLVSDLNANQTANYLLRTETNKDKSSYRRRELFNLTRTPDMELTASLIMARTLIDKIYPPPAPVADGAGAAPAQADNNQIQRSAAYRMAIISFLPDELAVPVCEKLRAANKLCLPISDEDLEEMAYEADDSYRKRILFPLKFGRSIGSVPVSSLVQFNNMENNDFPAPHYGLPVAGADRPYQCYLPLPPLADTNQRLNRIAAAADPHIFAAQNRARAEAAAELAAQQAHQQAVNRQRLQDQLAAQLVAEQARAEAARRAALLQQPAIPAAEQTPILRQENVLPETPARINESGEQRRTPRQEILNTYMTRRNLNQSLEEDRPLPAADAAQIQTAGDILETNLKTEDRVYHRGAEMYVEIGRAHV